MSVKRGGSLGGFDADGCIWGGYKRQIDIEAAAVDPEHKIEDSDLSDIDDHVDLSSATHKDHHEAGDLAEDEDGQYGDEDEDEDDLYGGSKR